MMKTVKIVSFLGIVAMSAVLVYGFGVGDFATDGALILANPWGIVSLVDLYTGFILFSLWIVFREKSVLASILWVIAMMVFGFFTGALYVFVTALQSKGDWGLFFMGSRISLLKQPK
jgi:hypothetical protein